MSRSFRQSLAGWELKARRDCTEALACLAHRSVREQFTTGQGYQVSDLRHGADTGSHTSHMFDVTHGATGGFVVTSFLQDDVLNVTLRSQVDGGVHGAGCLLGLLLAIVGNVLFVKIAFDGGGPLAFAGLWMGGYVLCVLLLKAGRRSSPSRAKHAQEEARLADVLEDVFRHAGDLFSGTP